MNKLPKLSLKKFYWKDYLVIVLGVFMYSLGVTQFIMPHQFVMGGITGVGVLLNYAFNWPVSVTVLCINAILLLLSFKILGTEFLIKTIYATFFLTFFLGMFERLQLTPILTDDPLIAGLLGSIVAGAGVGMVMSVNGSTGGTDIIVLIINKFRNITPGRTMLFIDLVIVSSSYLIFNSIEIVVFGLIIIAVMSTSVDWVLSGIRQSVQFFIVSHEYEEIATQINKQLGRGCTVFDATGWYTQQSQKVLLVMAKRSESNSIFRIVKVLDSKAFISQTNVVGVYGQGFDRIKA